MADDRRAGMYVAAAIFAGMLLAAGRSATSSPRRRKVVGPTLPPREEPDEDLSGEGELGINLDNVSLIYESSKAGPSGRRGCVVVLSNGTKLDGPRSYDSFRASWPSFAMSVTGSGTRRVLVNPTQVLEVMKSTFRRTNMARPDTVIITMGDSIVVREAVDDVRQRLGRVQS